MKAMVLERLNAPLVLKDMPLPERGETDVLIRVEACGVCRTDLHIVDGELPHPRLPLILGHQVVGRIEEVGSKVTKWKKGDRVGVPWLGGACGKCEYCLEGKENLCDKAVFTGYLRQGGYAEYLAADGDFIFVLPEGYESKEAAPLLCAGLIGYRAYKLSGKAKLLGFYGFGSSAHLLLQAAKSEGSEVYVFTRPGDKEGQQFALSLGATWAGGSDTLPPRPLDAALIFAPVGALMPQALRAVKKGGKVISAGIHMSDIPSFPYALLWEERSLSSVANLTRMDGEDFLALAAKTPLHPKVTVFPLAQANEALDALRQGAFEGSIVLEFC